MEASQKKRLGVIATIILIAGVITLLVAAYEAGTKIIVLQTWTPVEAELVDVKITNDKNYASIQTARADNYLVTWTFRYNIGGAVHVATADPGAHGNFSQMSKWSQRFQKGQTVNIHHKSDNPDIISAAQWDWVTFSHAAWVGAWAAGIIILGLVMRKFASA